MNFTSLGIENDLLASIIDQMSYYNNSDSPIESNRVVKLIEIVDDGGTSNDGVDTSILNDESTIVVSKYRLGDFDLISNTSNSADFTWSQATSATSLVIEQRIASGSWTSASHAVIDPLDTSATVTGLMADQAL